jgi:hypothetical protein
MRGQLKNSLKIQTLARDLHLRLTDDPVQAILQHCDRKIHAMMEDFSGRPTLGDMLNWVANKIGTRFEVIRTDEDLAKVAGTYARRGEKIFVTLPDELAGDEDFGITLKLQNKQLWEPEFVSVIDARGAKNSRSYFTKWHEIAHLLTLTSQGRLSFRRSHSVGEVADPEERMMDVIAGRFGFYPPIFSPFAEGKISFELIDSIKQQLCPDASYTAALINFAKFWPEPCMLIYADLGLKKSEEVEITQGDLFDVEKPAPKLRALKVTVCEIARGSDFAIHWNMRVPDHSIINQVFNGAISYGEKTEDLSWWESQGRRLPSLAVTVKARRAGTGVHALIIPIS